MEHAVGDGIGEAIRIRARAMATHEREDDIKKMWEVLHEVNAASQRLLRAGRLTDAAMGELRVRQCAALMVSEEVDRRIVELAGILAEQG